MFESRIKQLQEELENFEIQALLITSPYNIAYLTGIHAFSIEEREARLLLTKSEIFLFTDARYAQMVKDVSPFVKLIENSSSNPFTASLKELLNKYALKALGFEEENITYKEIADIEEQVKETELTPTFDIIQGLREIKDNEEIESIRLACALSDKAYAYIVGELRPSETELSLKTKLENFMRNNGGKLSFDSIVAFGKNSAIPHHMSNNTVLNNNDVVLLDFGAKVNGYCSDITRTVFVGNVTAEMTKIYTATYEAQEIALDSLRTHMNSDFESKKPAKLANSHLKAVGFSEIPHGLGHGVGLQVHENPSLSPFSEEKLKPGMIVTVEPGVYIPNTGGVRIEDTVLITMDGVENLTSSPKDLRVV
jgi:Xaa-Pro aminopeptidase